MEFKHLVRIANTDLDGNKQIVSALRKVKGIGFQFANAVCYLANVEKNKKTGTLTDQEVEKIEKVIREPKDVPTWMYNRKKDYETGESKHLISSDIKFTQDNDIKRLKKIRTYRGSRHTAGLPSRGQRTKSNFRRNKGKVAGVQKKATAPQKE